MNYLYITLSNRGSEYAISLDEILITLYGFRKKGLTRPSTLSKESMGIVYRVEVTQEQHENVRNILCDLLMSSHMERFKFKKTQYNFSSEEFVSYILLNAGITEPKYEIIFEGDLKQYVHEVKSHPSANGSSESRPKLLNRIKKNKEVVEDGAAQYEYVPYKMKELVAAD